MGCDLIHYQYIVTVVYLKIGRALNHGVGLLKGKLVHINIVENHLSLSSSKGFCIVIDDGSADESGEAIRREADKGTVYQPL